MTLYILPNGRMLLSPDDDLSHEAMTHLAASLKEWQEEPNRIGVIAGLKVVDLRKPEAAV